MNDWSIIHKLHLIISEDCVHKPSYDPPGCYFSCTPCCWVSDLLLSLRQNVALGHCWGTSLSHILPPESEIYLSILILETCGYRFILENIFSTAYLFCNLVALTLHQYVCFELYVQLLVTLVFPSQMNVKHDYINIVYVEDVFAFTYIYFQMCLKYN